MATDRNHIFISYVKQDKASARDLYRRLKEAGLDTWLDEENLKPGSDWRLEIEKSIRQSRIVIILLSNNSVSKAGIYQWEMKTALDVADLQPEGEIFLIPVRLEECDVPSRLSKYQWADIFTETDYKKLITLLVSIVSSSKSDNLPSIQHLVAQINRMKKNTFATVEIYYKERPWGFSPHDITLYGLVSPSGEKLEIDLSPKKTRILDVMPGYYNFYFEYLHSEVIVDSGTVSRIRTTTWSGVIRPGIHKFLIRKPQGFERENVLNKMRLLQLFYGYTHQVLILERVEYSPWKDE